MQAWPGNAPSWANMLSVPVLVHNLVAPFEMCFEKQGCKMCFITGPRHGWATLFCPISPSIQLHFLHSLQASNSSPFSGRTLGREEESKLYFVRVWKMQPRIQNAADNITYSNEPLSQLGFLKTFIEFRKFNSKLAFVGVNLRECMSKRWTM